MLLVKGQITILIIHFMITQPGESDSAKSLVPPESPFLEVHRPQPRSGLSTIRME